MKDSFWEFPLKSATIPWLSVIPPRPSPVSTQIYVYTFSLQKYDYTMRIILQSVNYLI